jgi:quinol-cytochrome oxidoreductase complex cytochrome b subunit
MTVFGKFILATFVSLFCMLGALGARHPIPLILIAIACWVLFVLSFSPGLSKNERKKREKLRMFNEFMKYKNRDNSL